VRSVKVEENGQDGLARPSPGVDPERPAARSRTGALSLLARLLVFALAFASGIAASFFGLTAVFGAAALLVAIGIFFGGSRRFAAALLAGAIATLAFFFSDGDDICTSCGACRGTGELCLVGGVPVWSSHEPAVEGVPPWVGLPPIGSCAHAWVEADRCSHLPLLGIACSIDHLYGFRSPRVRGNLERLHEADPELCRAVVGEVILGHYVRKERRVELATLIGRVFLPQEQSDRDKMARWIEDCRRALARSAEAGAPAE
jgi:hypothetical protein